VRFDATVNPNKLSEIKIHQFQLNQDVVSECRDFFVELVVELEVGHLPFGNVDVLSAVSDVS
jgi:hypothetical protein